MTDEHNITIRLLGRPEAAPSFRKAFPAKGFLMLGMLACEPDLRLTRTRAASCLWPALSEGAAYSSLRQFLARVRRNSKCTGDLIVADKREIRLGDAAERIDLVQFNRLQNGTNVDDLIRAIYLYRADFLLGATEPSHDFSQWLFIERARLRNVFFAIVDKVIVELTRYGRASETILRDLKNHVIAVDPEREASYSTFIEAFGRNGMFMEARTLYGELRAILTNRLGEEPSPETSALVRRVYATAHDIASDGAANQDARAIRSVRPRVAILSVADPADFGSGELVAALIEDVANELSRYRTFTILAPHSSQQITHHSGLPQDNETLNADYTVSGFLKPDGSQSTLALRMVNCSSADILWAAEYVMQPQELLRTFRVLSAQIAASLAAELEREMLTAPKFDGNRSAYWHYLAGLTQVKDCTLQNLRRARKLFQRAQSLDPHFAPAYGRIAQTLYLEWLMLGGDTPELLLKARFYAERAAKTDPGAAIGYWIGGVVDLYQRNFHSSAEQFVEAEALNPNCADLIVQHADALSHFGQAEKGREKFKKAISLNPLPPDHYWWAGASIHFALEDYSTSIDLCNRMKSQEPVLRLLAASHALAGHIPEARSYGRRVKEMYPNRMASEICKLAPDAVAEFSTRFQEGLRIAGV